MYYSKYNSIVKTLKIVNLDTIDKVRIPTKATYRRSLTCRRRATGEPIQSEIPAIKPLRSIKCSMCEVVIEDRRIPFIIAINSEGVQTNKHFKLCSHCFHGIGVVLIEELYTLPEDVRVDFDINRFVGMLK